MVCPLYGIAHPPRVFTSSSASPFLVFRARSSLGSYVHSYRDSNAEEPSESVVVVFVVVVEDR